MYDRSLTLSGQQTWPCLRLHLLRLDAPFEMLLRMHLPNIRTEVCGYELAMKELPPNYHYVGHRSNITSTEEQRSSRPALALPRIISRNVLLMVSARRALKMG